MSRHALDKFRIDRHPEKPKILFIGWPESSHTHSWIDLLENEELNVRLFCLPSQEPPPDWGVKCYLTHPNSAWHESASRLTVFPPPDKSLAHRAYRIEQEKIRGEEHGGALNALVSSYTRAVRRLSKTAVPLTIEEAVAGVINDWRPDVIHTLGFDPASYLYLRARRQFRLERIGRWVAQARGGPDLALLRYSPEMLPQILEVFNSCDHFIADNEPNYEYAMSAGLSPEKTANPGMGVVSGPGGIDVETLSAMGPQAPSKRERIIVWPKAYETYTAKAMPVFEAILKVWEQLQPCRIEMLWMTQSEVRIWYNKLFPEHIKAHCPAHTRLSREETLAHIAKARVLLAPSLSDGIPNTMLEAMALGAVPIVSPLDTIVPVVKEKENVLFANNLYPDQIADALIQFMSDDELVDRIAQNNRLKVLELADRRRIRRNAIHFYVEVASLARRS